MRAKAAREPERAGTLHDVAWRYERGAHGERITAGFLAQLPSGWAAMHDVRWPGRPRANLDHVVVGPAGVFVIDTKNWAGRATVRNDVLRQEGWSRELSVAGAADAALAVAATVRSISPAHVHPVLCVVQEQPLSGRVRDVLLCSPSSLCAMLLSRPAVLSPAQVAAATVELARTLPPRTAAYRSGAGPSRPAMPRATPAWYPAPMPVPRPPSRPVPPVRRRWVPAATPRASFGSAPRRGRRRGSRQVVGLATVASVLFVPGLVTEFGELVSALLTSFAEGAVQAPERR